MAFPTGTRISHFQVASLIGSGGMGEVYKARDTRLDRVVAIKVLAAHLVDRRDARERFEREARTIASLNHPHICTLYDIGQADGTDFLVMEYIEGKTLATRLMKGPLSLEQTLQYAIELADALDKAHRKGVTHRDIKPDNVMLNKSGTKLLDFGLAKLKEEVTPSIPASQLSTLSQNPTAEGAILGTLQYMAPEQLEGKVDELDGRTDIFAFGALVYEMATGKKAFQGKSSASLISAILKDTPPPISTLRPMTPPTLNHIVNTCLAKEPDERWQTAGDLCRELKWVAEEVARPIAVAGPLAGRTRRWGGLALVLGLASLIVAVVAGFAVWRVRPAPTMPATISRSVFTVPSGDRLAALDRPAVALSPDGSRMVYVAVRGNVQRLFLRSMDRFDATPIPGTEGGNSPFFSPDSQTVGFFSETKIKKVPIAGGPVVTLASSPVPTDSFSATWGTDDTIVFSLSSGDLWRVPATGGTPERLDALDSATGELGARWPAFLPGGGALLFNTLFGGANVSLDVPLKILDLKTGKERVLARDGVVPRYSPTGHLLYAQRGALMAAPFDLGRLDVVGTAVPVIEGIIGNVRGAQGIAPVVQYSLSENGSLVYVPGGTQPVQDTLVWVDRNGVERPLAAPPGIYVNPRVSPDGRHLAVAIEGQVWTYDLVRETLSRFTFDVGGGNPIWTPDGKRLTFQSGSPTNLYWQQADGSGRAERLASSEQRQSASSWSPDGQILAFVESNATSQDIWTFRLNDHKVEPFLTGSFNEGAPRFSPDGHWIAYVSDESGRWEVYVQRFPGPGGKVQISKDGAREPTWNTNGRELFYRSGAKMMAVNITTQPNFAAGRPRVLFEGPYRPTNATIAGYDVSPDGQRFLMVKQDVPATSAATQINVVLNWFEELKQKVPTGKK
jgi:eukaryotic-like serine/threonine-protein kinase